MWATAQYSVNLAMEATIVLVMTVLMVTCLLQRKVFSTTVPLISLFVTIILMLTNHIVVWYMLIREVPRIYGENPMRIAFLLDYVFAYCVTISFYYYISALIKDGYKQNGIAYKPKKNTLVLIYAWGAVTSIIYGAALLDPDLYRVENGQEIFSIAGLVVVHIISKFAILCAIALIIRHRKVIGKQEIALSLIFVSLISIFVIVDEIFRLCISYVILSLFTFILYVRIDLHRGLLLERQEREIAEWRTKIMLSQMQPHFLYNVLTTISSMCEMQNATQARDVVNRFADYFRANLDSLGKERTIPFERELNHVKTYLWLEKVRFEDALNIRYEIGPTDFSVPSLAIQPIVENAVKHGVMEKEEPGTVTIRTGETESEYIVVVEDDGVGFDVNEKLDTRTHVGIDNVSKRLEIICNGSCDIISKIGEGTIVTIRIPKGEFI